MNRKLQVIKNFRPWSAGSVDPPYRPGGRDKSHEIYDKPIPIRDLAAQNRVRCYRDCCGDDNIPGKYGEIFRYGIGRLGVQIGGPRANNTKTAVPERSNVRINSLHQRYGWEISQQGDGEIIFIVPESQVKDALKAIKAFRFRQPASPELLAKRVRALAAYRAEPR